MFQRTIFESKQEDITAFQMPGISNICRSILPHYLSTNDLVSLSIASKTTQGLFKQPLSERRFRTFQELVAQRKLDSAIKLLLTYPNYLIDKGCFFDYSGRRFINISVFEYLLWANDEAAWNKLLSCLPAIDKQKFAFTMLDQFSFVTNHGVTFEFNNQQFTECYYDDSMHIDAFKKLILNSISWPSPAKVHFCKTTIADLQRMVPVYIAEAICRTKSNECILTINQQEDELKQVAWYPLSNQASKKFAIVRGDERAVGTAAPYVTMMQTTIELLENIQIYMPVHRRELKRQLDGFVQQPKESLAQDEDTVEKGKCCVIC